MKVICQICKEIIAEIKDVSAIKLPLKGAMFASPDEMHGIIPPFFPNFEWEDFRCPHGQHRPMIWRDKILTSEGILNVPKNGDPAFLTQNTGEIDRSGVFDREADLPPMLTDEQAAAIVRAQMAENTLGIPIRGGTHIVVDDGSILIFDEKNIKLNEVKDGKTDTRQGQPEDSEPIEGEKEKEKDPDVGGPVDGEREAGTAGEDKPFKCDRCKSVFRNRSGLINHRRMVHNIRSRDGI